jgi:hypothetical protein
MAAIAAADAHFTFHITKPPNNDLATRLMENPGDG